MDTGKSSRFLKLTKDETFLKLRMSLGHSQLSKIHLWKATKDNLKNNPLVVQNLSSVQIENKGQIIISFGEIVIPENYFENNEDVVMTVFYGIFVYISQGKMKKDSKGWSYSFSSDFFRQEGRENERFMTYPHYKSYAYFFIPEIKSNLIFLKKDLNKDQNSFDSHFSIYQKSLWEKMTEKFGLSYRPGTNILELRMVDLGMGGFSVLANAEERESLKLVKHIKVPVVINNESFSIDGPEIIYALPFVENKSIHKNSVNWEKVGFKSLSENQAVENFLSRFLTDKIETEIRTDFLKFI